MPALQLGARIAKLCTPGTKVVSYKPLAPLGRTRGQRGSAEVGAAPANANDRQQRLVERGRKVFAKDGVSWTSTAIEYIRYEVA